MMIVIVIVIEDVGHSPALPGISSSSEQIPVPVSNSVASPRNLDRERQSGLSRGEKKNNKK